MPAERTSPEFSRTCPACGRRVPRTIASCRCGATLAVEASSPAAVNATESSKGSSTLLVGAAIVAALAGSGYWMFASSSGSNDAPATRGAFSAPMTAPAGAARNAESPEARAWNASANAKDEPRATSTDAAGDHSTPPSPASAATIEDMVDRVMPAVVLIETTSGRGSGFFISSDTLITNVHVVQNDGYVTLRRMDGSTVNARVANKAPAFDIAVLKVAQPSPSQAVIPMASAHSLKPGQEIIVIGSALGTLQNSVSRGIVSGLRSSGGATLVQTDAAVNPGNSGGPMLDRTGAVVGITTMGYRNAEGLNFGVAIDHARDIVEGRHTNLGTESGLRDIQTQSQSRESESDRQQQQGQQQMQARVGEMVEGARQIDAAWKRYREQCYQSPIGGSYDRAWFVMLVPGGMPANAGAGCPGYYSTLDANTKQFRDLMRRLIDDARRANVLPGRIREVLRSNSLDFEWER